MRGGALNFLISVKVARSESVLVPVLGEDGSGNHGQIQGRNERACRKVGYSRTQVRIDELGSFDDELPLVVLVLDILYFKYTH